MSRHKHRLPPDNLVARVSRGPHAPKIKLGTPHCGIIARLVVEERVGDVRFDREYSLHATKGYRAIRQ